MKEDFKMVKFTEIERVFVDEHNPIATPPFPTNLPNGGFADLASVTINIGRDKDAFLLHAVVNWSATFTPLSTPVNIAIIGNAQVTFQFLRNNTVIYQVIQSIPQPLVNLIPPFATAATGFDIASLLHFDTSSLCDCLGTSGGFTTFTLRATNIILTPPLTPSGALAGTVTAAAGPVTLVVEEVEACRAALEA
jgi:hypothetical protein